MRRWYTKKISGKYRKMESSCSVAIVRWKIFNCKSRIKLRTSHFNVHRIFHVYHARFPYGLSFSGNNASEEDGVRTGLEVLRYLPPRWDCWRAARPMPARFPAPGLLDRPRRGGIRRGRRGHRPGARRCRDRPRARRGRAWRRAWAAHSVPLQWTLLQEVQTTLLSLR